MIFSFSKVELSSYLTVCIDLFTYPKPVDSALNGHAITGGCMLALACDYWLMAAGKATDLTPTFQKPERFRSKATMGLK